MRVLPQIDHKWCHISRLMPGKSLKFCSGKFIGEKITILWKNIHPFRAWAALPHHYSFAKAIRIIMEGVSHRKWRFSQFMRRVIRATKSLIRISFSYSFLLLGCGSEWKENWSVVKFDNFISVLISNSVGNHEEPCHKIPLQLLWQNIRTKVGLTATTASPMAGYGRGHSFFLKMAMGAEF